MRTSLCQNRRRQRRPRLRRGQHPQRKHQPADKQHRHYLPRPPTIPIPPPVLRRKSENPLSPAIRRSETETVFTPCFSKNPHGGGFSGPLQKPAPDIGKQTLGSRFYHIEHPFETAFAPVVGIGNFPGL
jgi:hypothetical protein